MRSRATTTPRLPPARSSMRCARLTRARQPDVVSDEQLLVGLRRLLLGGGLLLRLLGLLGLVVGLVVVLLALLALLLVVTAARLLDRAAGEHLAGLALRVEVERERVADDRAVAVERELGVGLLE